MKGIKKKKIKSMDQNENPEKSKKIKHLYRKIMYKATERINQPYSPRTHVYSRISHFSSFSLSALGIYPIKYLPLLFIREF